MAGKGGWDEFMTETGYPLARDTVCRNPKGEVNETTPNQEPEPLCRHSLHDLRSGSKDNLQRMTEVIQGAKREHPDLRLVFFGETILGWFYRNDETKAYHERIAESIPGPSTEAIAELAVEHDLYISYGMTERADGQLYNAQVLIDPSGKITAVHRKVQIRNPIFTSGTRPLTTADVDGTSVALAICADFRNRSVLRQIRRARPDIVLASLADYATDLLLPRIMGTLFDAWTLVANRYGEEPPILWHGLITVTDRMACLRDHHVGGTHVLYSRVPIRRPDCLLWRLLRRTVVGFKLVGLLMLFGTQTAGRALWKRLRPSRVARAA